MDISDPSLPYVFGDQGGSSGSGATGFYAWSAALWSGRSGLPSGDPFAIYPGGVDSTGGFHGTYDYYQPTLLELALPEFFNPKPQSPAELYSELTGRSDYSDRTNLLKSPDLLAQNTVGLPNSDTGYRTYPTDVIDGTDGSKYILVGDDLYKLVNGSWVREESQTTTVVAQFPAGLQEPTNLITSPEITVYGQLPFEPQVSRPSALEKAKRDSSIGLPDYKAAAQGFYNGLINIGEFVWSVGNLLATVSPISGKVQVPLESLPPPDLSSLKIPIDSGYESPAFFGEKLGEAAGFEVLGAALGVARLGLKFLPEGFNAILGVAGAARFGTEISALNTPFGLLSVAGAVGDGGGAILTLGRGLETSLPLETTTLGRGLETSLPSESTTLRPELRIFADETPSGQAWNARRLVAQEREDSLRAVEDFLLENGVKGSPGKLEEPIGDALRRLSRGGNPATRARVAELQRWLRSQQRELDRLSEIIDSAPGRQVPWDRVY